MSKHSNVVPYDSPDGEPVNPWPTRINSKTKEEEPDYEAGEREYDKYDEDDD